MILRSEKLVSKFAFSNSTCTAYFEDSAVLNAVHERFEVEIKELPEQIDTSTYMPA